MVRLDSETATLEEDVERVVESADRCYDLF